MVCSIWRAPAKDVEGAYALCYKLSWRWQQELSSSFTVAPHRDPKKPTRTPRVLAVSPSLRVRRRLTPPQRSERQHHMDVVKRHRLGQPLKMVTLLTLLMGLILGGGVFASADTGYGNQVSITNLSPTGTIRHDAGANYQDNVVMEVSVSSDIGTDGAVPIVIRIPKAVSQDGISLSGIVVDPSLFSIQGIDTSSDPDYQIITVTPLNASVDTAFSGSFTVEFKASGAYSRDDYTIQGTEFSANYSGQTTSETRDFEYTAAGPATPVLDKWPSCSNIDVDGTSVCGLQQGEPQQNSFSLPVNYAQLSIPDAVVTDVAPSYTTIGSGNGVGGQLGPDISGVRIYKISFDADHYVDTVTNVTNSFVGKVTVSGNQLSVDFGDLTPDDSYAINYGLELHDENGLMEDNTATLTSSGIGGSDDTSLTVTYPCAPVNYRSGGADLRKEC